MLVLLMDKTLLPVRLIYRHKKRAVRKLHLFLHSSFTLCILYGFDGFQVFPHGFMGLTDVDIILQIQEVAVR